MSNSKNPNKVMRFEEYLSKDIEEKDFNVNNDEEKSKVDDTDLQIVKVVDVFTPTSEQDEADFLKQNEANIVNFDTDSEPKNIKRGDTMYLTVLLQRDTYSTGVPYKGILKVKVIDIYKGLGKLDELLRKQKKKK